VRELGALIELPIASRCLALYRIHAGEFGEAAALIDVAHEVAEANGARDSSWADTVLAAWRGDRDGSDAATPSCNWPAPVWSTGEWLRRESRCGDARPDADSSENRRRPRA
jgi:hypothetical protein